MEGPVNPMLTVLFLDAQHAELESRADRRRVVPRAERSARPRRLLPR